MDTTQTSSLASLLVNLLIFFGPILIIYWLLRSGQRGSAGMQREIGKSGAKEFQPAEDSKTFADVAGAEEAKEELMELVSYLKDPGLVAELGGNAPNGVLLVGNPGNGKTLLAKAVAGEAGVPFFSIAASEFVELFVGVGASRVRDLFKKAREKAPSVIFIDEIDAVGRERGAGIGGGHDEREQTLNQLLTEMDGFESNAGIVILAATNRPDVLDSALLRPGRFDLQVQVDHPDVVARAQILAVHTRQKKLAPDVDLRAVAELTAGFSGAQLEGATEQAVIVAARRIKEARQQLIAGGATVEEAEAAVPKLVTMADVDDGIDRIENGPAKESMGKRMSEKDKRNTSYHEVGHAWISQVMYVTGKGGKPVGKITNMPRGGALGYTKVLPEGNQYNYTQDELIATIMMAMGGRVAQEIFLNTIDTGASSDFAQASSIARRMVAEFGMSRLGPISVSEGSHSPFLGRALATGSESGSQLKDEIDNEWRRIVNECYQATRAIIERDRDCFSQIAELLIKKETILADEWLELYSQSQCARNTEEIVESALCNCIAKTTPYCLLAPKEIAPQEHDS